MTPIRKKCVEHLKTLRAHATPTKIIVSAGIALSSVLVAAGLHEHALVASVIVNMIWIWE